MGKERKCLQNASQEIKELQDYKHELHNWIIYLYNQIDMKDQLIEALELKLIQKQKQIDDMVDATYATNDLIQKVDAICDTEDLIQKDNATCDTDELIQKVDATCDTKDLMLMVDSTCDTHDLMVDTKETQEMDDDSLTSHEMESYSGPMKESLVEDESQEEAQMNATTTNVNLKIQKKNINNYKMIFPR
jgi:hypothetical protein